jgi:hypothetical protein
MQIKHVLQALLVFIIFISVLLAEYFSCSVLFRFVRSSDFLIIDTICGLLGIVFCYLIFKRLIGAALNEGVPKFLIWGFFILFAVLLSVFLRFTLQLTNGWLDYAEGETKNVTVTDRKISALDGSIQEGINPTAHLIYFKDDNDVKYEMLVPLSFYYSVDGGSRLAISLRQGLFHLPWIDAYQSLNYETNKEPQTP